MLVRTSPLVSSTDNSTRTNPVFIGQNVNFSGQSRSNFDLAGHNPGQKAVTDKFTGQPDGFIGQYSVPDRLDSPVTASGEERIQNTGYVPDTTCPDAAPVLTMRTGESYLGGFSPGIPTQNHVLHVLTAAC